MPGQFEGKVAFITGAASGIGREAALKFAQGGARVAIADISEAGGRETVTAIAASGGTAKFFSCDVSDPKQAQAAVEGAVKEFGRLDCAFKRSPGFGMPPSGASCPIQWSSRSLSADRWRCGRTRRSLR